MAHVLNVTVRDKVATADAAEYVCGNSDYTVHFDFDAEWGAYNTKTARFVYGTRYQDVVFTGKDCPVPVIENAFGLNVGVYAGNLCTTTPAYIKTQRSILCGGGSPADPPPDVYNQIIEMLNRGAGGGTYFEVDETLTLENGVLSVNRADKMEKDNSLPITSAAVYTEVGNINALLETI